MRGDESRVDLQNVAKLDNCFLKFAFIEILAAVLEVLELSYIGVGGVCRENRQGGNYAYGFEVAKWDHGASTRESCLRIESLAPGRCGVSRNVLDFLKS